VGTLRPVAAPVPELAAPEIAAPHPVHTICTVRVYGHMVLCAVCRKDPPAACLWS